ncbi:STAS domain-containing protein [Streptomyces sp. CB02009]|uniref:STAS domain-containing protein n=1 Tax=Streptomyces sp. CB02009 TaxID=1703938 RepID=UPI00403EEFCF
MARVGPELDEFGPHTCYGSIPGRQSPAYVGLSCPACRQAHRGSGCVADALAAALALPRPASLRSAAAPTRSARRRPSPRRLGVSFPARPPDRPTARPPDRPTARPPDRPTARPPDRTCASLTQVTDVLALCDRALILKLDLSSVSFIDSSGLHTLLHLRRDIGNDGGTLELCGVTGQALRLLDITGTRPLFTVRPAA